VTTGFQVAMSQILTLPRQAAAACFPSGLKAKELSGVHGNVASIGDVLKIFVLAFRFALTFHISAPCSFTVAK
jgi:hypothetical protein